MKYVGMDVHQEMIAIGVARSTGKLLKESILETKANTIPESKRSFELSGEGQTASIDYAMSRTLPVKSKDVQGSARHCKAVEGAGSRSWSVSGA
jgi:hypothetical protein